jgi:ribonuclease J
MVATTDKKTAPKGKRKKRRPSQSRNRNQRRSHEPQKNTTIIPKKSGVLRVIPLGGCEEIGRNMTIIEYNNDIIIVDMGLMWPEEDMHGIDYIIPNAEYLKGKEKNIKGVIITHGHYDHIGAIPHLANRLGNPTIYGLPLTLGIIAKRQEDFKTQPLNLQAVDRETTLKLGSFKVNFFGVSHNIPDSVGVVITSPFGKIVLTGDFKLDATHSGDKPAEIPKLKKLGKENVLLLMMDSTDASKPGKQLTEGDIQGNIDEIIGNAPGRLIIGTFASLIARIQQIIWAAEKKRKKVIIEGYGMKRNVELAQALGYMKMRKGTIIPIKEMDDYPRDRIVILCTGAQGEDNAVLMRIANKEHRSIQIEKGDTIVFSSSVIPGNERSVQRLKDNLYRQGAEVIHYQLMDVHAGGHGRQEDLLEMINYVKPKYFMPYHGYHSFLRMNAKLAMGAGIPEKNIFIPDNGQIVEFTSRGGYMTKHRVPANYVFVDGLGVGDVSHVVLRDRQMMAEDGMIVVIATVSAKSGRMLQSPDIISRGFIYMRENKKLVEQIRSRIKTIIGENGNKIVADEAYIKDRIRNDLGQFVFNKTQRRPMVLPVIIAV